MLRFLARYQDLGLLVLRVGLGVMFMLHGLPKMMGGPDKWHGIGEAIGHIGIHFAPTFFGFMAALSEFGGGICLIIGFAFRPACLLMCFTMVVATAMHLDKGDELAKGASHAVELAFVFFGLATIGPGRFSVDKN